MCACCQALPVQFSYENTLVWFSDPSSSRFPTLLHSAARSGRWWWCVATTESRGMSTHWLPRRRQWRTRWAARWKVWMRRAMWCPAAPLCRHCGVSTAYSHPSLVADVLVTVWTVAWKWLSLFRSFLGICVLRDSLQSVADWLWRST